MKKLYRRGLFPFKVFSFSRTDKLSDDIRVLDLTVNDVVIHLIHLQTVYVLTSLEKFTITLIDEHTDRGIEH